MIAPPELDSWIEDAILSIDFGIKGMFRQDLSVASDPTPHSGVASREVLIREWVRAMRCASAFHAAYREAVTKVVDQTRALDSVRRQRDRLRDQYDALRARTIAGAW